jgi:hypothetical protein
MEFSQWRKNNNPKIKQLHANFNFTSLLIKFEATMEANLASSQLDWPLNYVNTKNI